MKTRTSKAPHIRSYKKGGETWYKIQFSLLGVQVRKQGYASYEIAEADYLNIRKLIRAGEWLNQKSHDMRGMTLSEMHEVYQASRGDKRKPATIARAARSWRLHVDPVIGGMKVSEISRSTLTIFVRELRMKGLVDNTIHTIRADVNNVLSLAVEFEVLSSVPAWPKLKPAPKKRELVSPQEVVSLIAAVDKGQLTHQYRTMIRVQYELALRLNELLGLTVEKVDLEARTILIDCQRMPGAGFKLGPTKTNNSTALPLSPSLCEELRPYVEDRDPKSPLWISVRLRPVSKCSYNRAIAAAVKSAGIQKTITSHCLRASCLSYLLNHTSLSVMSVAYLGRHSPQVLLKHYAQADHQLINEFFSSKKSLEEDLNCDVLAITGTDNA
jgi:integrase